MSEVNIDSIRIEAKTNIKEAISDIEALKQSLTGLGDNKSGIDRYSTSVNGLTQRLTKLTGITNNWQKHLLSLTTYNLTKRRVQFFPRTHGKGPWIT